jgi:hypothetical protein
LEYCWVATSLVGLSNVEVEDARGFEWQGVYLGGMAPFPSSELRVGGTMRSHKHELLVRDVKPPFSPASLVELRKKPPHILRYLLSFFGRRKVLKM